MVARTCSSWAALVKEEVVGGWVVSLVVPASPSGAAAVRCCARHFHWIVLVEGAMFNVEGEV